MHPQRLTRRTALALTSAALLTGLAGCATAERNNRDDDRDSNRDGRDGDQDGRDGDRTEDGEDSDDESHGEETPVAYKPVLYLYPPEETAVEVGLDYAGELTFTYPEPRSTPTGVNWRVTASPDGTLTDAGSRSYPCLFWEGLNPAPMTQTEGFVVQADEVTSFLEDKLALLGLSDREAAELITFWGPRIQTTDEALITFAAEQHEAIATYTFTHDDEPFTPDVFIRVYLVIGDVPAAPVPEQDLAPAPSRHGFTAVEWGGCDQRSTSA